MSISEPRLRALLRQADRVAEDGKLAAARDLYWQISQEAPDSKEGWLGLARVSSDPAEKQAAYERVLALDEANEEAEAGLARLRGELVQETAVLEPPPLPATETAGLPSDEHETINEEDFELFCYRHPDRSTSLRCYKCGKPICSECTHKTPVGYLCPDCYREAEDAFFNARILDYLIALVIALPLGFIAGTLVVRFGGGFFFYILIFFIGGAIGTFIGRLVKRAIGRRRGRYIPLLVVTSIVLGVVLPALPILLALFFGGAGALFALIGPGIYLATAAPAAYYWSR